MNKKRILVTGGAGFIGSNLCRKLLMQNYKVICLDNLYSGRRENIEDLLNNPDFSFIEHNIIEPIDIECDEIYNLACPASPKFYQKDPVFTLKTNFIGMMNMLELAKKYNAVILQASTSEVYGNPLETPQKETYWGNVNPDGIRSCYDEGKRIAETLCMDYHRMYGTKIKIARIFNCYGPGLRTDDGRVVCTFIKQALKNEDLSVFGDGKQTRSLCYIDDLLEGFDLLIHSEAAVTGPVNLGNPEEMTVLEIAEKIKQLTGSSSKIEYKPLPEDDPVRRKPDISYAKNILGFNPKTDTKTGIEKTIKHYKMN